MSTEPTRPLWQEMMSAAAPHSHPRHREAARLRAIADRLAPDLPPPDPLKAGSLSHWGWLCQRHEEQQRLRVALLDEARRAEEGR